jgi:hypothetical protein
MLLVLAVLALALMQDFEEEGEMPTDQKSFEEMMLTQCYMLTSRMLNESMTAGLQGKLLTFEEKKRSAYFQKFYAANIISCINAFKSPEFREVAEKREDENTIQFIFKSMKKELDEDDDLLINDEEKDTLLRLNEILKKYQEKQGKGESESAGKLTFTSLIMKKITNSPIISLILLIILVVIVIKFLKKYVFSTTEKKVDEAGDKKSKKKKKKHSDEKNAKNATKESVEKEGKPKKS